MTRRILIPLCLALLLSPLYAWAQTPLKIGVLAYRPKPQVLAAWQPLGRYLEEQLALPVELGVYTYPELESAIAQNSLDVIATNSGHHILLRERNHLSGPLVTLIQREGDQGLSTFGGVIFTRADAPATTAFESLAGGTIATTTTSSLGGFQMQAYEMVVSGLPMPAQKKLLLTGMPHDAVVEAVLAGRTEFGFVRTGVLEAMAREGKLDMSAIRIINPQHQPGFPLALSTRLYPEWPVVTMPQVDEQLARRITVALLSLPAGHPASLAAGIRGFTIPADYAGVENLLRTLRLPPYNVAPEFTLADVLRHYWPWIMALAGLVALLAFNQWRFRLQGKRLNQIIWGTGAGAWEWNVQTGAAILNERWAEIIGYTLDELAPVSIETWTKFTHPDDLKRSDALLEKHFRRETEAYECEVRMRHKDGSWVWVLTRGRVVEWTRGGQPLWMAGTHLDITERKLAEEKLQLAASVFTHSNEGIMITDAAGSIIDVNDAFTRITGYPREEVLGRNPRMLRSGRQPPEYYQAMWKALLDKGHWYGEIWNRRKSGEAYAEMLTISAVHDAAGNIGHYVALLADITLAKEHQHQLEHIAHYDALTGLPNRVLLADRMHQAIAQSERRSQALATVYLDLDGFKAVNDRYGHDAGDELLIAVAGRMKDALRDGDTLARIGGDEFVAILTDLNDARDCEQALSRLLQAAADPVTIHGDILRVSASIGVTLYPDDAAEADQLLRHADQAMYQAKQSGKNRYHFFDIAHDASVKAHGETLQRLQVALANNELMLHYQPKVNMRTGEVIGVEALVRWQHPERGLLLPAEFLPAIENHALAAELDNWVLDAALAQLAQWHRDGLGLHVSVNVGARLLQQRDFVALLRTKLARHPDLPPNLLELEVLETSALEDMAGVAEIMRACAGFGVQFALDDFGTGYSSLTYLRRLPAQTLKIDQSFVCDLLHDPDDLAIVEGVVGMATSFRRQVIAEGVETVAHGEMLLPLGCELGQGYGIARPMPPGELPQWLADWHPDPRWTAWRDRNFRRDDLPLLFAEVDHRAWIHALEACLADGGEAPPLMDAHQCRFGVWLEREGMLRHCAEPVFQSIPPLHHRVHELGVELLDLHRRSRKDEALARLPELHALRDALVEKLRRLLASNCCY
ncbi:MAG: hypothetical protein A2Z95_05130 [Gallionellales bacterium GWA2_60_18]|nr:MAG: hypothetical protein A2Z95_05130 [Gallionellales bacterium GWA2_60_18]